MPTKNQTNRLSKKPFAYGSILEALSFGLYPDKRHVLREFVQNACDACVDWKNISGSLPRQPIQVKLIPPSIFIGDEGSGMDAEEIEKYRYLGYSEKDRRASVGFRGIGKDSGLAIAEKIIVTTTKAGINRLFRVVINAKSMLDEVSAKKSFCVVNR